jgi:anti-sigma regulatory factor (Ser/Thr protein kinase)
MNSPPHGKAALRIANRIAEMKKVVEFVERFGTSHGVPATVVNELNLCLDEILNNAISYGYDDDAPHHISIALRTDGRTLVAEIEDDAKPFDPGRTAPARFGGDLRSRATGGLGLHFVNSLMDEVDYSRAGGYNRLTLRKRVHPPAK